MLVVRCALRVGGCLSVVLLVRVVCWCAVSCELCVVHCVLCIVFCFVRVVRWALSVVVCVLNVACGCMLLVVC